MPHFPSAQTESSTHLALGSKSQDDVPARDKLIRIKNRRKGYLDLHPEYSQSVSLELAEPLLYDRLVRRFQTAAEREKDEKERGYSGVLEANLVRSEAKLEALENPDPNSPLVYTKAPDGSITAIEQDKDDRPTSREDCLEKWRDIMELRFLKGDDADFDYPTVDENAEYDDQIEEDRNKLDDYLQGEEERFLGEGRPAGQTGIQDF